jgi:anti-sigma B factor antagonist
MSAGGSGAAGSGAAGSGAGGGGRPAEFARSVVGDERLLVARGEIDVYTSPDFRRELQALIAGADDRVVVDFAAVDFIDSSGLGVLVGALKRAREQGVVIVLRSMSPATQKVFDITGLTQLFEIEP